MPVKVDEAWKERLRAACPELPFDRQRRFFGQYALPYTITSVLVPDRDLADYFEEAARLGGKPQAVGNWIVNDLLRELGQAQLSLAESKVRPGHVAALVQLVESGAIPEPAAREVFADMFRTGEEPEAIVDRLGLKAAASQPDDLERWCREAIAADPRAAAEFQAGKESAINAFKGPVMRAAKGKANPKLVDEDAQAPAEGVGAAVFASPCLAGRGDRGGADELDDVARPRCSPSRAAPPRRRFRARVSSAVALPRSPPPGACSCRPRGSAPIWPRSIS